MTSNLDYQEWDQRRPRHLGLSCRFVIEGLRNLRPARTYGKALTAHRLRMGIHRMDADLTEGVHPMSAARYSAVPLILTILFACASLVRGVLHPSLNFDLIPYSALAKEVRGAGGKNETYRELATKVGEPSFQTFVSGAYRERLYADDASFEAILPFYSIRPLYILLCSVIGLLIGSDVAATFVVSAIFTALAVILSYAIAQRIGPPRRGLAPGRTYLVGCLRRSLPCDSFQSRCPGGTDHSPVHTHLVRRSVGSRSPNSTDVVIRAHGCNTHRLARARNGSIAL